MKTEAFKGFRNYVSNKIKGLFSLASIKIAEQLERINSKNRLPKTKITFMSTSTPKGGVDITHLH